MLDTMTVARGRLALHANEEACSERRSRNEPATKLRQRPSRPLAALATILLASCTPCEEARVAPGFGPEAGPPPRMRPRVETEPLPAVAPPATRTRVAAPAPSAKPAEKAPAEKTVAKAPAAKPVVTPPAPKKEPPPAREMAEKAPPAATPPAAPPRVATATVKTISRAEPPATSPLPERTDGLAKVTPVSAAPAGNLVAEAKIKRMAAEIATELAARCPVADPADQKALAGCRQAMYGGSKIRSALGELTAWGRQHRDPATRLINTNLTKFAPDVLTGMYLPLFMFTGKHTVTFVAEEQLYRIELATSFRNRLPPGLFPYPFWHEDDKWATYQAANAILLWVDPATPSVVRTAQFTSRGTLEAPVTRTPVAGPPFDGKWMWTDASGELQPKVTLFDGIFAPGNPHLKPLEESYRALAITLRDGQCLSCHVPSNPNKMKRLVLLQTPAHAAGDIKRIMESVRKGSMPVDPKTGTEEPLKGELKDDLLRRAAAFEQLVDAAKAWEAAEVAKRTPAAPHAAAKAPAAKAPTAKAPPAAPEPRRRTVEGENPPRL